MPRVSKARKALKSGKALTRDEREAITDEMIAAGGSPWIIERNGKKYEFKNGQLVPLTGDQARAALGRGKKSRKVS